MIENSCFSVSKRVQNFSEISPGLSFTEYNFYDLYRQAFENNELGRIKKKLPLREMTENLGLKRSMRPKRGRQSYFTPKGKVALMFLKMLHRPEQPEADGVAERQHPLPVIRRCKDRPDASSDEL